MSDVQVIATVARGSRPRHPDQFGPDSRCFFRPIEVYVQDGRVLIDVGAEEGNVGMWAEEAEALGAALIRAAQAAGHGG